MRVDKELLLSNEQPITTDAPTEHTIDLTTIRDIGKGEPLFAVVVVDEEFAADGAATLEISLISADEETLLVSPTTILTMPAIGKDDLTKGRTPIVIPIPFGIAQQYIGLQYTIATPPMTGGKVTAFVTNQPQSNL